METKFLKDDIHVYLNDLNNYILRTQNEVAMKPLKGLQDVNRHLKHVKLYDTHP